MPFGVPLFHYLDYQDDAYAALPTAKPIPFFSNNYNFL